MKVISMPKKILFYSLIVLLIVFFVFIGVNYFYYDDTINKNYIVLDGTDNTVSITSILPLTDSSGKEINNNKNGMVVYKKINIKNRHGRTSKYRLLLNVDKKSTLDPKYIKIIVSDENDKILDSYNYEVFLNLNKLDNKNNSYVLYSSKLKKYESTSFIIRLWVDTFYVLNDEDEKFYGDISIYSY